MNERVNYDEVASTYNARYTSRAGEWEHTIRPVSQITEWMREAGYSEIRDCVVERILNHQYGRAVLVDHPLLQKKGTSQLILLSDKAYADGLARLKADLEEAEAQGKTLTFPADISLVMIAAQRK